MIRNAILLVILSIFIWPLDCSSGDCGSIKIKGFCVGMKIDEVVDVIKSDYHSFVMGGFLYNTYEISNLSKDSLKGAFNRNAVKLEFKNKNIQFYETYITIMSSSILNLTKRIKIDLVNNRLYSITIPAFYFADKVDNLSDFLDIVCHEYNLGKNLFARVEKKNALYYNYINEQDSFLLAVQQYIVKGETVINLRLEYRSVKPENIISGFLNKNAKPD